MRRSLSDYFLKMGQSRPLFHLFPSFRTVSTLKNLAASGDRTRIFGVEGRNADHKTTTRGVHFTKSLGRSTPCSYERLKPTLLISFYEIIYRICKSSWPQSQGNQSEEKFVSDFSK